MLRKIVRKIIEYIQIIFYSFISALNFKIHSVNCGHKFKSLGKLCIKNLGEIDIGDNVHINSAHWANPIGAGYKTYLQTFKNGKIIIGDNTGISNTAITSETCVRIGKNVMIGAGCKIYDTDFHPLELEYRVGENLDYSKNRTAPIVIKDGVFIGASSIILKGVTIGEESIIGAGSVVTKDVPPREVWAGNPAKFLKSLNKQIGLGVENEKNIAY